MSDVILKRMFADVYLIGQADPRMLTEALLGEAAWRYGNDPDGYKYEFGKAATRLHPEPEEESEEEKSTETIEATAAALFVADIYADYCNAHQRKKQKNGMTRASRQTPARQKYKCPACDAGKPPVAGVVITPRPPQTSGRVCPVHSIEKLRNGCRECRRDAAANRGGAMFEAECPTHGLKQKSGMKGNPLRQSYKPCKQCAAERASAPSRPVPTRGGKAKGSTAKNNNPPCKPVADGCR